MLGRLATQARHRRRSRERSTSARRRCPSLSMCAASRCQPGAPPPSRRSQRHRRHPQRSTASPRRGEAVTITSAPPSPRCACRAAPWQWGSNSAPPPSLGRAPIPPEPSISKSGPRDLEFEYPGVVFKIERARYKIDTRCESSTTRGCSRHGFALAPRCCRRSCSI